MSSTPTTDYIQSEYFLINIYSLTHFNTLSHLAVHKTNKITNIQMPHNLARQFLPACTVHYFTKAHKKEITVKTLQMSAWSVESIVPSAQEQLKSPCKCYSFHTKCITHNHCIILHWMSLTFAFICDLRHLKRYLFPSQHCTIMCVFSHCASNRKPLWGGISCVDWSNYFSAVSLFSLTMYSDCHSPQRAAMMVCNIGY